MMEEVEAGRVEAMKRNGIGLDDLLAEFNENIVGKPSSLIHTKYVNIYC